MDVSRNPLLPPNEPPMPVPSFGVGAPPTAGERIEAALFEAASRHGAKTALVDGASTYTYAELAERAESFAARLSRRGLVPGDRVAIYLEKSAASVIALYGTWRAGGIAVPMSDVLRRRQVDYIVEHSGSRFTVASARTAANVSPEAARAAPLVDADATEREAALPGQPAHGGGGPAAILYTSGSTGRPKGILVSHANLLAGVRIVSAYLGIREDDRLISIPPFSFDYGLNQLLMAVGRTATLVLQRSPFPADVCRTLVAERITSMAAVPPLWLQLLHGASPFPATSFPDLRLVTNTGGVLPPEAVRRLRELLPHVRIFLMYGLSEAFRSTYLAPEEVDRRPTSIGKAIPECEILVLGPDGRRCGPGEPGELVHRGPTVALGYWNDPDATAAVFRPVPFAPPGLPERAVYSGDLVTTDEEGFLYFVGRRGELIKSQGYRISPTEVEEIVFDSGLVKEVVAKAGTDPVAGQVVVVHCVPADPTRFTAEALLEYCRREMPRYMVPRQIVVHPAFPRTASGKIDRQAVGT